MTDDLEAKVRDWLHADAPASIPDGLAARLSKAPSQRAPLRFPTWQRSTGLALAGIAAVAVLAVVTAIVLAPRNGSIGLPAAPASPLATERSPAVTPSGGADSSQSLANPTASSPLVGHLTDGDAVLLRLSQTGGGATGADHIARIFSLYGDGRVVFRSFLEGQCGPQRQAQLSEASVQSLLAFALDDGGLATSPELYPFNTFGPAGTTVFEIDTSSLQKRVEYQLPLGNLFASDDAAVKGLQLLAAKLVDFQAQLDPSASPVPDEAPCFTNVVETPSPAQSDLPSPFPSTVRSAASGWVFEHPATWKLWQPNTFSRMNDGPLFYLMTDEPMPTCAVAPEASANPPDAQGRACDWPVASLSPNAVLVELTSTRILEPLPTTGDEIPMNGGTARPQVDQPGPCAAIGADETISVLVPLPRERPADESNLEVIACLRGPDLAIAATQFQAFLRTATVLAPQVPASDPRARTCSATEANTRAMIEIASGNDFWLVFPHAGLAPELSIVKDPVFLAVYRDGYPAGVSSRPGTVPSTPGPGEVDVCAVLPDGSRLIYGNIPLEGSGL
jgi:hypothetical protein